MRNFIVAIALALTFIPAWAQKPTAKAGMEQDAFAQALQNNPGLMTAIAELFQKMQKDVKFPPDRSQSRLLPLLPESTVFYAALPNYGDAAHQMVTTFHEQLEQSPDLRSAWEKTPGSAQTPKFEDGVEKFYQLSQFLGDEIVFSASPNGSNEPRVLILTDVRKAGLKDVLASMVKEFSSKTPAEVQILGPSDLAAGKDSGTQKKLLILVRPDFVAASSDLETLRQFNARVEGNSQGFAATPFGQRVMQAYEGGTSYVGAFDLHAILGLMPSSDPRKILQDTGFGDAKYLVWRHGSAEGQSTSEFELSFNGPRHGMASWLAAPGPMESLEYVSPNATMVMSVLLKKPAEIFDDIAAMASSSNPNAMASVTQMEQGLNLSLRNDILGQLSGEITIEAEAPGTPQMAWRAILRTNDPGRMQATLKTLFAAMHVPVQSAQEDDVTYNTFAIPNPQKPLEVSFAFVSDYLVFGSSKAAVAETVQIHRSGESLAKSPQFIASLPHSPSSEVSALVYEDAATMMAFNLRQASPEFTRLLTQSSEKKTPVTMYAYGESTAIREASHSPGVDVGAALVVAAIAIPNFMRARTAANESSAIASLRTINTAQIAYSSTYPQSGFARSLAVLGPGPQGASPASAEHANLIDNTLGNATCVVGTWCTKSGYRFILKATCIAEKCGAYVAVATPESGNTGTKNFCSASDAVIREQAGPPMDKPITAAECRRWQPVH